MRLFWGVDAAISSSLHLCGGFGEGVAALRSGPVAGPANDSLPSFSAPTATHKPIQAPTLGPDPPFHRQEPFSRVHRAGRSEYHIVRAQLLEARRADRCGDRSGGSRRPPPRRRPRASDPPLMATFLGAFRDAYMPIPAMDALAWLRGRADAGHLEQADVVLVRSFSKSCRTIRPRDSACRDEAISERVHAESDQVHAESDQVHALFDQVHALFDQVHTLFDQVHTLFDQVHVLFE